MQKFQQPQFGMSVQAPAGPQQGQQPPVNHFAVAGGASGLGTGGGVSVPPPTAFGSTNQLGADGSQSAAAQAVQGINVARPAVPPEHLGQRLQLFA